MSLQTGRLNLTQRLAQHVKSEIALQAEGFASEPGLLQHVGKRFMRVSGQYFVPGTLQEIVLLGVTTKVKTTQITLRTTYMGGFSALLVKTGTDYIEVIVSRVEEEEKLRVLIPLSRVISIEQTKTAE
jgi:hypothetical protein